MKKLLAALFVLFAATQAQAQDKAQLDQARAEGKVAFYANITSVEPIMEAFTADTGVKAEYTRLSTTKFVATILTEHAAGKLTADVLQAPDAGAGAAQGEGRAGLVPLPRRGRVPEVGEQGRQDPAASASSTSP